MFQQFFEQKLSKELNKFTRAKESCLRSTSVFKTANKFLLFLKSKPVLLLPSTTDSNVCKIRTYINGGES